jgi:hypothetical protein
MNEAVPARLRPAPAKRKRSRERIHAAIACFAVIAILGLGYWMLGASAISSQAGATTDTAADKAVGTIKLGRDGDRCRQLTLDNRTGQLRDDGAQPCHKPASSDPKEQLRERYSGGRLDSIRDSFRSR